MRVNAAIALEAAAPGVATRRPVVVKPTGDVHDEARAALEAPPA